MFCDRCGECRHQWESVDFTPVIGLSVGGWRTIVAEKANVRAVRCIHCKLVQIYSK